MIEHGLLVFATAAIDADADAVAIDGFSSVCDHNYISLFLLLFLLDLKTPLTIESSQFN